MPRKKIILEQKHIVGADTALDGRRKRSRVAAGLSSCSMLAIPFAVMNGAPIGLPVMLAGISCTCLLAALVMLHGKTGVSDWLVANF